MKKCLSITLGLAITPSLFAQSETAASLPDDPNGLLRLAAPFYDYSSADMKPWHIRYHYQYLDENGQPGGEGTFDFWQSTSKMSRASWTQGDQTHSEWRTTEGKQLNSGSDIPSMVHRLYWAFVPGFLKMDDSASGDRHLKLFKTKTSSMELACVGSVRAAAADKQVDSFGAIWPAYCFREQEPVLAVSHENGSIVNAYGKVQKFQSHYFPGQIEIFYLGKKRVEATLEELKEVDAEDMAFTPAPDAKEYVPATTTVRIVQITKTPVLIKRVEPVYPSGASTLRVGGTVVISATIGTDGKIKNARIVSSPDASLSAAALDAVAQWRYEPSVIDGRPVEMPTTIHLNFDPKG